MDFESALYKIDTSKPDPSKKFTIKTHLHKPYGFTIYLVWRVSEEVFKPICYRANTEEELEKVPEKLSSELEKISKFIAQKYNSHNQLPTNVMDKEEFDFQNADVCHICEREFDESDDIEFDEPKDIEFDENYEPEDEELYDPDVVNKHDKYKKVRDHCHLSGKYRGAAHKACNLNLKLPRNIPVFCRHGWAAGYATGPTRMAGVK